MGRFVSGWDAPELNEDGGFGRTLQSGAYYKPSEDALNLYVNAYVGTDIDLSGASLKVTQGDSLILQRYFERIEGGWALQLNAVFCC